MKKYVIALVSLFLSFNVFASLTHEQSKCVTSLNNSLSAFDNFKTGVVGDHLPWRIPHDIYAEVPPSLQYIFAWESYLECIQQDGKTTEAKIQKVQNYVDYILQDFNNYVEELHEVHLLHEVYLMNQRTFIYVSCSSLGKHDTLGLTAPCLLD